MTSRVIAKQVTLPGRSGFETQLTRYASAFLMIRAHH